MESLFICFSGLGFRSWKLPLHFLPRVRFPQEEGGLGGERRLSVRTCVAEWEQGVPVAETSAGPATKPSRFICLVLAFITTVTCSYEMGNVALDWPHKQPE